jgi:hypothetical protein
MGCICMSTPRTHHILSLGRLRKLLIAFTDCIAITLIHAFAENPFISLNQSTIF